MEVSVQPGNLHFIIIAAPNSSGRPINRSEAFHFKPAVRHSISPCLSNSITFDLFAKAYLF